MFLEFDMEEIKVKYFTDDIDELCYVEGKSDWIDLHAAETVTMKAGEFRLIPLGVAIALPEGYEAHIVPRSSTFKNYGILQTNSMGVVDYTYRGEVVPKAQFTGEAGYFVPLAADRGRNVVLSVGFSALAGYESSNWGNKLLHDGARLRDADCFLYGRSRNLSVR